MAYGLYLKVQNLSSELKTVEGQTMQQILLDSIKKRLFSYEERTITRMATLLDRRFKKKGFQIEFNAEQASINFENVLMNLFHNKPDATKAVQKKTGGGSDFFEFVEERGMENTFTARSDAIIAKRHYLAAALTPQDTDPLLWLRVNQNEFCSIGALIKKYLCVPATSVESERMFSKAGQIVSDRRTRLKEKNINMLLFLNKNTWLLD